MHHAFLAAILLFVLGSLCFAAFSWGVKSHFRSTGAMPLGMKVISAISLAEFLWFVLRLVIARPSGLWPIAAILFAAALAIFFWTVDASRQTPPTLAYDTDEPSFLLHHGPYKYVRHPFYLSYLLFWIATAAATPGLLPWAAPALMLLIYWNAATREERKFAQSGLAPAYAQYRAQAGMFLPHFGLKPSSGGTVQP